MKHGSPYNSDPGDARVVLDSIRRIVQVLRVGSRAAERDVGVSAAQLFVLDRLASSDRPLSVNELAERTLTHQSSVSVVVQKLQRRGLIERVAAAADARRAELSLTAAARKLLRKAPRAAQDQILVALDEMSATDRRTLGRLLAALAKRLTAESDETATAPAMLFEDNGQQPPTGRKRSRARS